ncbi:hypothetical protein IC232_04000 [Microvirga sp. BT688]|uniref:hypothetical protein n=1 Tax=Microvirga sp. TaxID=1873136 RepID=UPI00168496BF|nr:hypothetical protein [Microvirga sp.]MBD2745855.1 hypothetical protein [Microvirga sp.]
MLIRILVIAFTAVALTACGTLTQEDPIGIGRSPNDLKKSPCACIQLPNAANDLPVQAV